MGDEGGMDWRRRTVSTMLRAFGRVPGGIGAGAAVHEAGAAVAETASRAAVAGFAACARGAGGGVGSTGGVGAVRGRGFEPVGVEAIASHGIWERGFEWEERVRVWSEMDMIPACS